MSASKPDGWSYPAIAKCMGEGAPPGRTERRMIASRILREGFQGQRGEPSFAIRRKLWRAAEAALSGTNPK